MVVRKQPAGSSSTHDKGCIEPPPSVFYLDKVALRLHLAVCTHDGVLIGKGAWRERVTERRKPEIMQMPPGLQAATVQTDARSNLRTRRSRILMSIGAEIDTYYLHYCAHTICMWQLRECVCVA